MSENKTFSETRKRSLTKTVSWRCVAVINSFTILSLNLSDGDLSNAIFMNITGFFVFYAFERIWNVIRWGRNPADQVASHAEVVS